MIQRAIPFLIPIMFFITACGTSVPHTGYVVEMKPAIEQLSRWQNHYQDFESLLMDPGSLQNGMSRIQMIELYNMATEYKITRDDYVDLGFLPLDILVGDANKFAREGVSLVDLLSAITPDTGIQDTHQAILECVQIRVAFAEEVSLSLRDLDPIDLSGDVSPCGTFDADLETLAAYVNGNQ